MSPNSSIHRRTWDLVPWIVNGTADARERAAVETHLSQCEACREELQFQRALRAGIAAQPALAATAAAAAVDARSADAHSADADEGWQRLRARLDHDAMPAPDGTPASEVASAPVVASAPPAATPARGAARARRLRSNWAMGWAAAAALEAVALGVLGMALWSRNHPPQPAAWAPAYRTLSAADVRLSGASIRMVLEPRTTLAQLQTLLERSGLTIVAGPSASGVWSLAPSIASGQAATAAALRSLRADPAVRFAEPLATPP